MVALYLLVHELVIIIVIINRHAEPLWVGGIAMGQRDDLE